MCPAVSISAFPLHPWESATSEYHGVAVHWANPARTAAEGGGSVDQIALDKYANSGIIDVDNPEVLKQLSWMDTT